MLNKDDGNAEQVSSELKVVTDITDWNRILYRLVFSIICSF